MNVATIALKAGQVVQLGEIGFLEVVRLSRSCYRLRFVPTDEAEPVVTQDIPYHLRYDGGDWLYVEALRMKRIIALRIECTETIARRKDLDIEKKVGSKC